MEREKRAVPLATRWELRREDRVGWGQGGKKGGKAVGGAGGGGLWEGLREGLQGQPDLDCSPLAIWLPPSARDTLSPAAPPKPHPPSGSQPCCPLWPAQHCQIGKH